MKKCRFKRLHKNKRQNSFFENNFATRSIQVKALRRNRF